MQNQTLNLLYSPEVSERIHNSNILIIGVGGIGCELLKVLTNSGFRKMTLVDLDTIEMTNLNRQFYFRREHVGMSKAIVGKQSVMKKHPDLDITAIHTSIFSRNIFELSLAELDIQFYQKFDLVFCALDNAQAREHLGRMCIRSQRIMIDAGTGGYSGQTNVIKRFFSQCNNCQPSKPAPSFAVCTIRASPSEPIHCVVFSIALYNLMFGQVDESNYLSGLLDLALLRNIDKNDENKLTESAIKIFNILFYEQIKQGIESYIQGQKTIQEKEAVLAINQFKYPISYEEAIKIEDIYTVQEQTEKLDLTDQQKLKPFKFYAQLFVESFIKCMRSPNLGTLKFDKDDWDSVNFVAAVTNMRTFNFTRKFKAHIEEKLKEVDKLKYLSVDAVRQLGGKIVPAIASTNAIAAALQTIDAKKVFAKRFNTLRYTWITPGLEKLSPTYLPEPQDSCQCCSDRIVYLNIEADFDTTTLQTIVDLADIYGVAHLDINTLTAGTIYGKENREMVKSKLNEINAALCLKEFNEEKTPYSTQAFVIHEQLSSRKYFWQNNCRYEFSVFHSKGLIKPRICKTTPVKDTLTQLKKLQLRNMAEIRQERQRYYDRFGY